MTTRPSTHPPPIVAVPVAASRWWTEFVPPDRTSSTCPTAKPGLVIEDNDEFAHNLGPDTRSWSPVWVQLLSYQGVSAVAPTRTETQIYDQLQEALDRARCWYQDVITAQYAFQDFSRLRDVVLCTFDRDHKLGLWRQPDDGVATLSQAQLATSPAAQQRSSQFGT